MLNIYLKVREAVAYSKCRFSKFKMFVSKSVFGEHQLTHISFNLTFCCNLNMRGMRAKLCVAFLLFLF